MIRPFGGTLADGHRGSVRGVILVALLVIAAIAGHFFYTQHQEKKAAEAQAAAVAAAAAEAEATGDVPADEDAQVRADPTPSSNSPRVAEAETISNIRSGR